MRISEHAAIGNGRSVALIARDGTIDWLCWPRFDSPSVVAELLDPDAGAWSIAVRDTRRITRAYVPGTNVLETVFEAAGGTAVLTDAMTLGSPRHALIPEHELVRIVRCERGEVAIDVAFAPRPGFGTAHARLENRGPFGVACENGSELLTLRGELALALDERAVARGERTLRAGESAAFSLTFDAVGPATFPPLGTAGDRIAETIRWWRGWLGSAHHKGPNRA